MRDFHASSESFQAHMFPPEGKVLSGHLQHAASAQPTTGYPIIAARNVPGHKLVACANAAAQGNGSRDSSERSGNVRLKL